MGSGKGFDGPRGRLSVESSEGEGEGGASKNAGMFVFFSFGGKTKYVLGTKALEGGGALFLGHDAIARILFHGVPFS